MFFGRKKIRVSAGTAASGSPAPSAPPETERSRTHEPARGAPGKAVDTPGDKRDLERVPLSGQVRGEVMVFQPMTILDISLGGAQIETAFPLQLASLHDFRLSLADRSVVVRGRIAHCHIGELTDVTALYRSGVEFVALSDHAQSAIADFVRAVMFSRSAPPVV